MDYVKSQEQSKFQVSLNFAIPLRTDLEGFGKHIQIWAKLSFTAQILFTFSVSSAILQRRLDGTIDSLWQSELVASCTL